MSIHVSTLVEARCTVLKVDGWLKIEDVDELTLEIQGAVGPTTLDLSELHSIDREVTARLREWIREGVTTREASPYLELLLALSAEA